MNLPERYHPVLVIRFWFDWAPDCRRMSPSETNTLISSENWFTMLISDIDCDYYYRRGLSNPIWLVARCSMEWPAADLWHTAAFGPSLYYLAAFGVDHRTCVGCVVSPVCAQGQPDREDVD